MILKCFVKDFHIVSLQAIYRLENGEVRTGLLYGSRDLKGCECQEIFLGNEDESMNTFYVNFDKEKGLSYIEIDSEIYGSQSAGYQYYSYDHLFYVIKIKSPFLKYFRVQYNFKKIYWLGFDRNLRENAEKWE